MRRLTDQKPTTPPKRCYVYYHRNARTGAVIYVGKGSRFRAWEGDRDRRRVYPEWGQQLDTDGLIVEIIVDGLSARDALLTEKRLQDQHILSEGLCCWGYSQKSSIKSQHRLLYPETLPGAQRKARAAALREQAKTLPTLEPTP